MIYRTLPLNVIAITMIGWFACPADAQTSFPLDTILRNYENLSNKAYSWDGRIQLRGQRMLLGSIGLGLKKEFAKMYGLSPLNPVYRESSGLFFKSHATLDWNIKIEKGQSHGNVTIVDSITNLLSSFPVRNVPKDTVLRRLTPPSGFNHPFTLLIDADKVETNLSPFILPRLIVDWHYLPRLWYPPLEKIGYPSDNQSLLSRMQDERSLALVYTPNRLDNHLLEYVRELTGNPELQCENLTNILLIDTVSFSCRSFSITVKSEGKQQPVFSIANSDPDPLSQSFPIPSTSTLMTNSLQKDRNHSHWTTNYFCQFHFVKSTDR